MRILHVDAGRGRGSGPDRIHRLAARLAVRPGVDQAVAGPVGSRLLEAGRWDLVHVHGSRALRTVVVALAASGVPTRLVATRRAEGAPRWPALWRRADLVLAVSGAVRDALAAAGIGAARLRVVPGAGERPGSDPPAGSREAAVASREAAAGGRGDEAGTGVEREAEATMAAYREVLGSWRRRRHHARWMERAARASRALPPGPSP